MTKQERKLKEAVEVEVARLYGKIMSPYDIRKVRALETYLNELNNPLKSK